MGTEAAEPDTRAGWTWKDAQVLFCCCVCFQRKKKSLKLLEEAQRDMIRFPSKKAHLAASVWRTGWRGLGRWREESQEVRNGAGKKGHVCFPNKQCVSRPGAFAQAAPTMPCPPSPSGKPHRCFQGLLSLNLTPSALLPKHDHLLPLPLAPSGN